MRPYRDIATVAALQVVRFPGRAHFEPQFFLLHLYQTIVYVALLILLFYREDGRAYMDGMLTPIAWLGMVFASGLLGGCNASGSPFQAREGVTNDVSVMAGVSAVLSVLMTVFCARHGSASTLAPAKPPPPSRLASAPRGLLRNPGGPVLEHDCNRARQWIIEEKQPQSDLTN